LSAKQTTFNNSLDLQSYIKSEWGLSVTHRPSQGSGHINASLPKQGTADIDINTITAVICSFNELPSRVYRDLVS